MAAAAKRIKLMEDDLVDAEDDAEFTKSHQLLLQYLVHTRMVRKVDLIEVHEKLFKDEETLERSLSILTNKIDPLKVDIKQVKCDLTGITYYIIVHTAVDAFFNRCSSFSKTQTEFLKQVFNGIVLSTEGFIGNIQAINSCKNLSKSDAQETLRLFVKSKLLVEDNNGFLYLSPLAVVEFEPYFKTCLSGNLSSCDFCKKLVFLGSLCHGCGQKFHKHCVATWLNSNHTECPKCSEVLDG